MALVLSDINLKSVYLRFNIENIDIVKKCLKTAFSNIFELMLMDSYIPPNSFYEIF